MMRIAFDFLGDLVISGLSDPAKVLNFLDLAGAWNPSFAFKMAGATIKAFFGYRPVWRRNAPTLDTMSCVPASNRIDRPLILGAVLFAEAHDGLDHLWLGMPRSRLSASETRIIYKPRILVTFAA